MASNGHDVRVGFGLNPPGQGFLSEPWKQPGLEYPSTPGLLGNVQELCCIAPSIPKLSAVADSGPVPPELLAQCEYELFKLQQPSGEKVSEEKRRLALDVAKRFHDTVKSNFLGFQANMGASYSHLSHYLDTHVNNIGDPYTVGSFLNQSKFMERAVLDYFAALWRAEWPHDVWTRKTNPSDPLDPATPENTSSYWGFVLSMGCTEGTLYGMWNGRDYLAGKIMLMDDGTSSENPETRQRRKKKPEPTYIIADQEPVDPMQRTGKTKKRSAVSQTPVCFFSSDSHYSLKKAMVILNIKTFHDVATELNFPVPEGFDSWPTEVPSNEDGSVNVDSLAILVEEFAKRGYPALICLNYGTTFKGAYDNVEAATDLLLPIFDKYGLLNRILSYTDPNGQTVSLERHGFWFHVDGALGAAYMPFLKMAKRNGLFEPEINIPEFDFSLRGKKTDEYDYSDVEVVHSIGMSGHKWIGAPVPTGVYMTKSKYQLMPPEKPNYIGTPDTTFAGSRSGLASVFLWDYFSRHSFHDLMTKAVYIEKIATTLAGKLKAMNDLVEKGELHQNLSPRSLWIRHTPLSLGVIFRRPKRALVIKYSLSEEEEFVDGESRKLVHAYAMEHVTFDRIDSLIKDLLEDGAFDLDESESAAINHRFKIEW